MYPNFQVGDAWLEAVISIQGLQHVWRQLSTGSLPLMREEDALFACFFLKGKELNFHFHPHHPHHHHQRPFGLFGGVDNNTLDKKLNWKTNKKPEQAMVSSHLCFARTLSERTTRATVSVGKVLVTSKNCSNDSIIANYLYCQSPIWSANSCLAGRWHTSMSSRVRLDVPTDVSAQSAEAYSTVWRVKKKKKLFTVVCCKGGCYSPLFNHL